MSNGDELRGMLMTFRVSELQMLLGFASQNKTGRKSELQARALALLKNKSVPQITQIHSKIRELYKTIQQGTVASEVPSFVVVRGTSGTTAPTNSVTQSNSAVPASTNPSSTLLPPTQQPQQPLSNSFMSLSSRQGLYNSVYGFQHQRMPSVAQVQSYHTQPPVVHPDVKFKKLPFYDILAELIKPSSLAGSVTSTSSTRGQESSFVFYLTPQQATDVSTNREVGPGTKNEYPVQIQLRFCLLETSCEQDDLFPAAIGVKVNGKPATLPNPIPTNRPGVEPRRPPRPVNISPLVKLSPTVANHITVTWAPEYSKEFVLVVNLVRKLSAQDLLTRLQTKGVKNADYTTGLIKDKFKETDGECEIATTSLRVSLLCPLGKMKMNNPVRSTICSHLQCFDASLYLQMNEKRPTWTCPVCDKNIPYDTLVIDGYFLDVLKSGKLPSDQHEVQLLEDGSWSIQSPKAEEIAKKASVKEKEDKEVIEEILDEDEDISTVPDDKKTDKEDSSSTVAKKKIIEIDLCSDSDGESTEPSTVRSKSNLSSSNSITQNNKVTSVIETAPISSRSIDQSIIMLDSPSPPPSPANSIDQISSAPASGITGAPPPYRPPISYPQIIQGAGQNTNRPLVMQIRLPPGESRYHPY